MDTNKKPVNFKINLNDKAELEVSMALVVATSDLEHGHLRGKKAAEFAEIRSKRKVTQLRAARPWLEANHYMTDGKLGGKAYRASAARIEKNKGSKVYKFLGRGE